MICTRSLQLTVKKTTRSLKTLEGTLTIMKNGERSTISTRCADMDLQVPLSLGVSPAILEYVIFCHQEESTWPLSEPAALKKRFDEIFEALKYTNALEQIKSVRKDQVAQVKLDSVELAGFKAAKERAARIQRQADEQLEKINSSRTRIRSLDVQMSEALEEQNQLFTSGQEFERILADMGKFRHERSILQDTYRDLSRNVEEYDESDADLEAMKTNFAVNTAKAESVIDGLRQQETAIRSDIADARSLLDNSMTEQGRVKAEAHNYDDQLAKREEIIKTISRTHNIRGFDTSLDEDRISEFKEKINQLVKSQTLKLDRLRRDGRAKESELNNDLNTLQTRLTEQESRKGTARSQILTSEERLVELESKVSRQASTDTEITTLEAEIAQVELQMVELRKHSDKSDWEACLRERNLKLREQEDRVQVINREITNGNKQSDTRAQLSLLQSTRRSKEEAMQVTIKANSKAFLDITGENIDVKTMDHHLRIAMTNNSRTMEDQEEANAIVGKEVSTLEAQLGVSRDTLKAKRKEELLAKEQILEVFDDIEGLDQQITELEKQLEHAQSVAHQSQFASKFYENAIKFADQQNCCQLCSQSFHEDFTRDDFKAMIDTRRAAVPKSLTAAQDNIAILSEDLISAKSLIPVISQLSKSKEEMPALELHVKSIQEALTRAVQKAEDSSALLQRSRLISKTIVTLERVCAEVSRLQRETTETSRQITNIESELQSSGSIRSIDDMQTELTSLQDGSRQIQKEITQIMADKDASRNRNVTLDGKRRDLQLALSELHGRAREEYSMNERINEHRETIRRAKEVITSAQRQIDETQPELSRLRLEFDALQSFNSNTESSAQRDASRLVASQNSLLSAEADIEKYLSKGGPEELQKSSKRVAEVKVKVNEYEASLSSITESISQRQNQNSNLKTAERNIDDNLRLRRVKNEIGKLEAQIQSLTARNAERDREQYMLDSRRLKDKYSALVTERAGLLGEITQLDNTLKNHQKELTTEYKDADEVYRTHLIKVRTMEKANEDLEKYGKALDNAIMKYHSLKMEEINKIIDELWKATYCGTDVDSILIKSEGESKVANRSYNYRVCMIKGDAELDMRGRCSAGQKVLAAIIIRLALAECFGVNCGILALDEPTTNLDRENIESLAKSLASIISIRRSQKNFQLIVITHDEEFLRMMGCSDYCDYYYRVSRNEHQKSIIERHRVSTVL